MTRREFLLAAPACAGLAGCLGLDPRMLVAPAIAAAAAEANLAFGFELYDRVRQGKGNRVFSPFGMATLLSLAAAGAEGQTLAEFKRVLHRPETQDLNHAASAALQVQLAAGLANSGCELRAAHGAWVQRGVAIHKDFEKIAQRHYGGALQSADFSTPDMAVRAINQWIEMQTAFKIKGLLAAASVPAQTRFLLAGAVHFKGVWAATFPKGQTCYDTFHLPGGAKTTASFMRQCAPHRYAESGEWQAVELAYAGAALSMLVVVPRIADGLAAIEADIATDRLRKFIAPMNVEPVVVSLPRFRISCDLPLVEPLRSLGLVRAFQAGEAEFGRLSAEPLALSTVVHRSTIEVSESGADTAAAGEIPGARKHKNEPKLVSADRPFLVAVRDSTSGSILFLGRIVQP